MYQNWSKMLKMLLFKYLQSKLLVQTDEKGERMKTR